MNQKHLELCASDEWAATVAQHIIPGTLQETALGDDVLELGPGPGRTTEVLHGMTPRFTALELDAALATALAHRFRDTNVRVVRASATRMPLPDGHFSDVLSITMLHHVPSAAEQDAVFRETARVLRPGGLFRGVDSLDSDTFRALHEDDICVPLDPATLRDRLLAAGFAAAEVDTAIGRLRFAARKAEAAPR